MNKFWVLFFIAIASISCNSKKTKAAYERILGQTQGSTFQVSYENSIKRNLTHEIDSLLLMVDNSLSIYNPNAIIFRLNNNEPLLEMDDMLKDVIKQSFKVWKETDGYFDLTVGPLVKAWGFGPNADKDKLKSIDSLVQYIGMDKIQIKGHKLVKKYPQMQIDVNAIAQGYTVDVICDYLEKYDIENYLVEVGGEVRAKGTNPKGENWKVGIDKPVEGSAVPGENIQAIVPLHDLALATSGNYRKFYIENGIKYSHTIDPFTGRPAKNNLLSVSIFHKSCATADAYATACMAMGLDKAIRFVIKNKIDAYFVYSNSEGTFKEFITPKLKSLIIK